MKKAILATKVGMTQIFNADGVLVPVTVLEAGPCSVTQIKTVENDGYSAVQVAYADKKEKVVSKDANGKKKQQVYSYKKDDKKYTEIVNVLDQYSYHFTTKTLTNSSQMSDSSKPQMIMLFGNKMLVISDSGEILLDNHVYRMGYSGGKDAKKMMKSINKILKSE